MIELSGKSALITGGGGGIGGGMAEAFVERGMSVILADVDLDFAQAKAAALGSGARAIHLDVTSADSWAAAKAKVGDVDVLCNNAGVGTRFEPLLDNDPGLFERVMAINVTGVYNGVRAFAPAMVARGSGHIVNTSSMNGLLPHGTFVAYCTSKFAVVGLSDSLRQELEPQGVGISVLFPGLTRSRMAMGIKDDMGLDDATFAGIEAQMMDPLCIGRVVADAIVENRPYIITHPDHKAVLEARHASILAAFGEPAEPGYGGAAGSVGKVL